MTAMSRPSRDEAADYYFKYIDLVPEGDVVDILWQQEREVVTLLQACDEDRSLGRYAPGKWSIREVVAHVNDTERLFAFRAFWIGRGFEAELPSFDQELAATAAKADDRTLADHLDEFQAVRLASLTLFDGLPQGAWARRGIASGNPISVRALAYLTAGHASYHLQQLRELYLA